MSKITSKSTYTFTLDDEQIDLIEQILALQKERDDNYEPHSAKWFELNDDIRELREDFCRIIEVRFQQLPF